MITKNGKILAATTIVSTGNSQMSAYIPVKTCGGDTVYTCGRYGSGWPKDVTNTVSFQNHSAGIQIGSGDTPESENDYRLSSIITSGLSASTPSIASTEDSWPEVRRFVPSRR